MEVAHILKLFNIKIFTLYYIMSTFVIA